MEVKEMIEKIKSKDVKVDGEVIKFGMDGKEFEYEIVGNYVIIDVGNGKKVLIPKRMVIDVINKEREETKKKLNKFLKELKNGNSIFERVYENGDIVLRNVESGESIVIIPYVCTVEYCMNCNECRHFNEIVGLEMNNFEFELNELEEFDGELYDLLLEIL